MGQQFVDVQSGVLDQRLREDDRVAMKGWTGSSENEG
jgi:hypothetical protein